MKSHHPSRRRFLQAGAAAAALHAMPGVEVFRSALAQSTPRTLIAIHLNGGNDTLNTVVPWADPRYYTLRGPIALDRNQVLRLDDRRALHPALTGIKALWDRQRVAIVHGVGYPNFDFSHFQAMEIYWTADPKRVTLNGWLGRALDTLPGSANASLDPLTGASIGWGGSPSLLGRNFTAPLLPPNAAWFSLPSRGTAQQEALKRILLQPPTTTNLLYDAFLRNGRSAIQAYDTVAAAGARTTPVAYPGTQFASGLKFAAQLLREDDAVRVIAMEQGSYDTHENQLQQQQGSLQELSAGVKAFCDDLDANGLSNRVLILLWSEFSRRVEPNAQNGTDHGSAQAMLLIGAGVRAGIVGNPPSLAVADLVEDGNLPMAVDFRNLYATVLDRWLGVDSKTVLGASYPHVPVLL
jgi:uncharacterized protein (DUF1501 family)